MRGRAKVLGLAMMAVAVLGAVGAQGAVAVDHTFQVTSGGKYLTGTLIKHPNGTGPADILAFGAAKISCTESQFTGEMSAENEDAVSLTPALSGCKLGETAATITNEGCSWEFDSDTTSDPNTGGESAAVHTCKGGGQLKMSAAGCVITFGEQGPLHGVKYANEGTEPTGIEITFHKFGIKYTTNKAFACTLAGLPASGEGSNGTTLANFTLKAYKEQTVEGEETTHSEQVGAHVTTP